MTEKSPALPFSQAECNLRNEKVSKKIFVISESRPHETVKGAGKRTGEALHWWAFRVSLAMLFFTALTLWINWEADSQAATAAQAKPQLAMQPATTLDAEISADPFGVRNWGSAPSATDSTNLKGDAAD